MYKIELRRSVQKSLDKLPKTDFDPVIAAIGELAKDTRPLGIEEIKSTGLWRVTQGDYPTVYFILDETKTVHVVHVGHRRDIHRSL